VTASSFALDRAIHALRAGGVIAYPTEGVWGLGCHPFDAPAVRRLLHLKGRSETKGLILVAADVRQVEPWLERTPPQRLGEILASWPGPVTWIVPAPIGAPSWITGGHPGVAIRVSAHPPVQALCRAFGGALVSTSANPQGRPPARSALAVRRYFGTRLDYILNGELGGRRGPSQMREALSGRVLRTG